MKTEVAIVGGGPVGCFLAKLLAEKNIEVMVIEEHAEIGNPACCAGIVGIDGLKELSIKPGDWVLGRLSRTKIYPPAGSPVEIGRGRNEAYIIDRAEFDRSLAREAARAGARFLMKSKCIGVKAGKNPKIRLAGGASGEISASLVVGADGPASTVWRCIEAGKKLSHVNCAQMEVFGEIQKGVAEIYLGKRFFPGFFGWGIKAGKTCRIGLGCVAGNPMQLLQKFVETHPAGKKFISNKESSFSSGPIPPPFSRKMHAEGIILVGDSAGHVKPLTGGGIYLGLSSAKIAADVISSCEWRGVPKEYASRVRKRFGMEAELGRMVAKLLHQLSDNEISNLVKILGSDEILQILKRDFDFDHHGKMIRGLLAVAPSLLRKIGAKAALKSLATFVRG